MINPLNYLNISYSNARKELFQTFPPFPNPIPAVVFLAAIFTTIRTTIHFFQGKGIFSFQEMVLLLGGWAGHHAVLINTLYSRQIQITQQLRETLEKVQLEAKKYKELAEEEKKKVEALKEAAKELNKATEEVKVGIYDHGENQKRRLEIHAIHEQNLIEEKQALERIERLRSELEKLNGEVREGEKRKEKLSGEMKQMLQLQKKLLQQMKEMFPPSN